jgi:hypothetical protein
VPVEVRLLPASLALALVLAVAAQWLVFAHPEAINDDVRNQAYWMLRIGDPTLFPHDWLADFFTQPALISPFMWLLYRVATTWFDPLRTSQFLAFPIILITTYFLYRFAAAERGPRYAFRVCWLFNCFIWTMQFVSGGLPRAFFYPLLFWILWQAGRRNYLQVGVALCFGSLIYPPVTILCVPFLFYWHHRTRRTSDVQAKLLPRTARFSMLVAGVFASAVVLALRYAGRTEPAFGRLANLREALQVREFYPHGRVPLFPRMPVMGGAAWPVEAAVQIIPHLYFAIPLLLAALWYRRRNSPWLPPSLVALLKTSVVVYALAFLAMFYLYVPERYLQYTVPLLVVFLIAGLLEPVPAPRLGALAPALMFALPLLICYPAWTSDVVVPTADELALAAFLRTTPKDTMVLTELRLASGIPAFAARSVFLSHEGYLPFNDRHFALMKARLKAWLEAAHATGEAQIRGFLAEHNGELVVIDRRAYTAEALGMLERSHYHAFPAGFFRQLNHGDRLEAYALYRNARQHPRYENATFLVGELTAAAD